MQQLNQVIDSLKQGKKLQNLSIENQLSNTIVKHWTTLFGSLKNTLHFSHIRDKTLYIHCKNPAWKNEIHHFKAEFIRKINALCKQDYISDINLIYSTKKTQWNKSNVKKRKERRSTNTLKENIQDLNQRRRDKGYQLCSSCAKVWSPTLTCLFCEQEKGDAKTYGKSNQKAP